MVNKKLFIITLEPLEQRYTKQWYKYFKNEFSKYFDVIYIDGEITTDEINTGRFLDINKTNKWKGEQVIKLSNLFINKQVDNDSIFLFTDGWHSGIINLKYMIQLNNLKCKIFSYWHAGSWDEWDFITQKGFREWCYGFEESLFNICDGNFVSTRFHKNLIIKYFGNKHEYGKKIYVVGFPMDWIKEINSKIKNEYVKENMIIFPHRLDLEKQPEVFDKLKIMLPQYKFIKTMEVTNNKEEYYNLIARAKIAFSSSLQETFGIGMVEALMLDCIPLVPKRLSYKEMYNDYFKYRNLEEAKDMIINFMNNYNRVYYLRKNLQINKDIIRNKSLNSIKLMSRIMLK